MHIGAGEGVIEKARSRQPRLDSPFACQCEILKAGDGPVNGKVARKLGRKIALSDIEAMPPEKRLPSKRGEPRAGSLDVIDLGHFQFSSSLYTRHPIHQVSAHLIIDAAERVHRASMKRAPRCFGAILEWSRRPGLTPWRDLGVGRLNQGMSPCASSRMDAVSAVRYFLCEIRCKRGIDWEYLQ
jgi:hypothetical protein